MSLDYSKQKKRNTAKVISVLLDGPLSFKEIERHSGLSRSTINHHLKELRKYGIVKKIYGSGQLLNQLILEKVDTTDFFFYKLEPFGVPEEILEKGKKFLGESELIRIVFHYEVFERCVKNFDDPNCKLPQNLIDRADFESFGLNNSVVNKKIKIIKSLEPFGFHVFLASYGVFRHFYSRNNIIPTLPDGDFKVPLNVAMGYFFAEKNQDLREKFDRIYEWWFGDVAKYSNVTDFLRLLIARCLERQDLSWKIY